MILNSCKPWYHGSPFVLTSLLTGSTITQDRDLARIFSHKPALVSQDTDDEGKRILKHTGNQPGFLYRIAEAVKPDDVYPHPQTTMGPGQEWLTTRPLRVELLCSTQVVTEELLTASEIEALRQMTR